MTRDVPGGPDFRDAAQMVTGALEDAFELLPRALIGTLLDAPYTSRLLPGAPRRSARRPTTAP
ncbi:MAG: hypothetical protein ACRD0D_13570, partial [Acidimicrobiales bacterium]